MKKIIIYAVICIAWTVFIPVLALHLYSNHTIICLTLGIVVDTSICKGLSNIVNKYLNNHY